jgi:hypothetical protein
MFGLNQQAKVPNSSQYDFKGASVTFILFRLNLPQAHISQLLQEQVMLEQQPMEQQAAPNQIKDVGSAISFKTKQVSSKEPNIGLP